MGLASRSRSGSSITAHRLFAPGLALWFGALFGLSSLAVRTGLFEELVVASRLDQVVPAAAPPLGHAARLALALAFALAGGLIGWAVARVIATLSGPAPHPAADFEPVPFDPDHAATEPVVAEPPVPAVAPEPYQVRARDAHPDAPARRPILAREELRDAGLDQPLAPAPEAGVPPPPPAPPAIPPAIPQPAPMLDRLPATCEPVPSELPAPEAPAPQPVAAPPAPLAAPAAAAGDEDEEMPRLGPVHRPAAMPSPAAVDAPAAPPPVAETAAPVAPPQNAATRILEAAPASLSHVELIERLAIAMRRREAALGEPAAAPGAPAAAAPADAAAAMRAALDGLKDSGAK
jgi:hypothetical protein